MSEWKKVKLGEICLRVFSGGTPSKSNSAFYENGDIPWLNTGEVKFQDIYSTENYITQAGYDKSAAKWVEPNSIIIAMYGATAGKSCITRIRLTTNQACCNLHVNDKVADYRFVYYTVYRNYLGLASLAKGGAQQNLNAQMIKDYEIALPPLPTQHRIAAILSDYDAAIANCRKQIALLEEAAMRLYREWVGDGKGERRTLRSLVEDIESGSRPRGGAQNDGVPSIGAEKIEGIGVYNFDGEKFISEDYFDRMRRGKIRDEDILLYKDGAYCGKVSMVLDGFPHSKAAVNEHVFILRTPRKTAFLYCFLRTSESYALLNQLACNKAAQPGLNQDDVLDVPIILPDLKCIEKFEQSAMPFMHTIAILANQIRSLTEARDRLLPKLMKGEIEV